MSVRPSVRPYVRPSGFGGNVIFSASNWDNAPFFVHIPLINEHLVCKYFVHLSVGNATKGFVTYGCFHPCLLVFLSACDQEVCRRKKNRLCYSLHTICERMKFHLRNWEEGFNPPPSCIYWGKKSRCNTPSCPKSL